MINSDVARESSDRVSSTFGKVTHATVYAIRFFFSISHYSLSATGRFLNNRIESKGSHQDRCDHIQKLFQYSRGTYADIRKMDRVLAIDTKSKTAHVQSLATFETLLDEALKVGLRPKVAPALRGATIREAIECGAVQSSSFKEGLFFKSVLEAEVMSSSGQIITCSRTRNSELFNAMPYSCGTLGCILSAKIELVAAKPYVALTYTKFDSRCSFLQALKQACEERSEEDFVESVIYSDHEMILIKGKGVDEAPYVSDYIYKEIFYEAVRKKLSDYLNVRDFFFRWDRDYFWLTKGTFAVRPWVRNLFGTQLLRSDRLGKILWETNQFYQNVLAPFERRPKPSAQIQQCGALSWIHCDEFLKWFEEEVGAYPLYLCPTRREDASPSLCLLMCDDVQCHFMAFATDHKMETKILSLGGMKLWPTYSFYNDDSFKKLYSGLTIYDKLKKRFDPERRFFGQFSKR